MSAETERFFDQLLASLAGLAQHHRMEDPLYLLLKDAAIAHAHAAFSAEQPEPHAFGPFGKILFPYHRMGAIDSVDLFGIDELIIFSFYHLNRQRYRKVADIGANLGLHSLILDRCGFEIRCFEPDPVHFKLLQSNLTANGARNVTPTQAAVSDQPGETEFVRVLGNTTGSHIKGARANPYGELEVFEVKLLEFRAIAAWADLIKMDIEGHERQVLLATTRDDWANTDMMLEVTGEENATAIFDHMNAIGVNLYAQRLGWGRVTRATDMPTSHRTGSLFVSALPRMPWQQD